VVGGALSAGGNLVAHMAALVGVRPAAAEALVARLPVGAEGVLVLPGFWGERSPGWPDESRGGVFGLTAETPPAALVRAAMESVGAGLGAVADALDGAYGPDALTRVRAGGGAIARSPALAQVAADAIGRPVDLVRGGAESSALGAARDALAVVDLAPSLPVVGATFSPRADRRAAYRRLGERLAAVAACLAPADRGRA
jgi:sugar (pentulose or hexulose) kinase